MSSHSGFKATDSTVLDAALAYSVHVFDLLRQSRTGVVIAISATPIAGLGAAVAKSLAGGRVALVVRVQGHSASRALLVRRSIWRWRAMKAIASFVLCRADVVITLSAFTRELALSQGARSASLFVLPYPVKWADDAYTAELPARPTVLFVGRLEEEKGVHILLEAMTGIFSELPTSHLLVAGDGAWRARLEQIADSRLPKTNVSFLGWLGADELRNVYSRSWVLVLPSLVEEGLGMVLVEAGLMGRAVIGSDLGGIREIVKHGQNGFLVPPGDLRALATAILTLLTDPDLARRIGRAGPRFAREYLSGREEALQKVRQAIDRLVPGRVE